MASQFKKAVIISCGQVEIVRPPAGPAVLAGICEVNNLDYEFLDLNIFIANTVGIDEWSTLYHFTSVYPISNNSTLSKMHGILDRFVDQLATYEADLILISVLSYWQNSWCEELLKKIKEKNLSVTTIVGGSGISIPVEEHKTFGKHLINQNLLDYYVLGEGEVVLDKFFKGEFTLGLNSAGNKFESWAVQIDNLNQIPFPSYKKIDSRPYVIHEHAGEISITGSRGCVRRCTFCDVGAIWKKFRFRSAENIAKEIEQHYRDTGQTKFFFTDSLVNGSLKTFIQFMEEIIKLQEIHPELKNIRYSGQFIIRPASQHPEYMYDLMKRSGFGYVIIGVESGSNQVRYHMGKKFDSVDVDYHMEMCSKYQISNLLLLMVGYPTETLEDFYETIDMVKRYQKYRIDGTLFDVNESQPLIVLKNTPLYDMAEDLGIDLSKQYSTYLWESKLNPDLTVKERFRRYIEFQRLLVDLNFPRPTQIINEINEYLNKIEQLVADNSV